MRKGGAKEGKEYLEGRGTVRTTRRRKIKKGGWVRGKAAGSV
jgi:hypothetical protein